MIRKSDKEAFNICRKADLLGCNVRRALSVFDRIRRAHVRYFNDLMWGSVQPNPMGFLGISNVHPEMS